MAETAAQKAKREADARRAAQAAQTAAAQKAAAQKAAKPATKLTPKPIPTKPPVSKPAVPKPPAPKVPVKPKTNTSSTQSTWGVVKSLLPGGQKANLPGLGKSTLNFLGEATGVYDVAKGVQKISDSGLLPGGKKADWGQALAGLGQTAFGAVQAVPGLGLGVKGATTALRAAGALNKINKANKFVTAATKTGTAANKLADLAYKPLIGTTKVAAKDASLLTKAKVGASNFLKSTAASPMGIKYAGIPFAQGVLANINANQAEAVPTTTNPTVPGNTGTGSTGTGSTGNGGYNPTLPPITTLPPTIKVPPIKIVPKLPISPTPETPGTGGTGGAGTQTPGVGDVLGNSFVSDTSAPSMQSPGFSPFAAQTPGAPSASQGTPAGVQLAGADFAAGLAANAAKTYAQEAANREALSQGFMGAAGTAADIYGGRAAGIMGQGITGQRRNFVTSESQRAQESLAQQSALAQAYSQAVAAAYGGLGNNALEQAQLRSEAAAKIRSMG